MCKLMKDKTKSNSSLHVRKFESNSDTSRTKRFVLLAFPLLLGVLLAVVIILPNQVAKKNYNLHARVEKVSESLEIISDEELALQEKEIEILLNKILKFQAHLESDGVKIWGAEMHHTSYGKILTTLAEADTYKIDREFEQALMSYNKALNLLEQLEASRPERARVAMEAGNKAFELRDSELAIRSYQIVLAAQAGNEEAQIGLRRATNLPQVLQYISQGEVHEKNAEWELAKEKYSAAVLLDGKFRDAIDHLRRVEDIIRENNFQSAMTDVINNLNQEDIESARRAFDIAKCIHPNAEEVRDLEKQLKSAELRIELERLNNTALQFEHSEQWEQAVQVYNSMLELDPNAGFALHGKKRSENYAKFMQEVQNYISYPEQLQAPEHVQHARKIYEIAIAQVNMGPKFEDSTEKLANLLEVYDKPVNVLIKSDDLTDVRIYRVGNVGHFITHRLMLKPGSYKAHGLRSGYRDVIVPFTVPIGGEDIVLEIFCREKI
jgi:eukaryotic-like serine/threonine-protein kinase